MRTPTLICFGEVLWDLLPAGKIAGGAPLNVAFHAQQLGLRSQMISRVGSDGPGRELLSLLDSKGVSTRFIQTDPNFSTGTVNVSLDENGSPTYDIVQPAAWDFIHPDNEMSDMVKEADALMFGSLACRNERSKSTLFELLEAATFRVFDLNLRPPFYSGKLLEELLGKADIVKVDYEELNLITGFWADYREESSMVSFLKEKFGMETLIVTKGDRGAACFDENGGRFEQAGFQVEVRDTIGCGDAFLAAFLSKMLSGENTASCLRFACAVGALTAAKAGGTPAFSKAELHHILNQQKLTTN